MSIFNEVEKQLELINTKKKTAPVNPQIKQQISANKKQSENNFHKPVSYSTSKDININVRKP